MRVSSFALILVGLLTLSFVGCAGDENMRSERPRVCGYEMHGRVTAQECGKGSLRYCTKLAYMYIHGQNGRPKSVSAGINLYQETCDKGYTEACFELAEYYTRPESSVPERLKGKAMYEKACQKGFKRACEEVAEQAVEGADASAKETAKESN